MSQAIDGEILTEYLGVTVQMTLAQHDLIMEASLRCGSFPPDFIVKSALAAARNLVPAPPRYTESGYRPRSWRYCYTHFMWAVLAFSGRRR